MTDKQLASSVASYGIVRLALASLKGHEVRAAGGGGSPGVWGTDATEGGHRLHAATSSWPELCAGVGTNAERGIEVYVSKTVSVNHILAE